MPDTNFTIYKPVKLWGGISLISALLVLFIYSIILNWKIHCPDPDLLITISKGASAGSVATSLNKSECLENESIFKLALTLTMKNKKIIPGRYNFKGITTIWQVVKMITSPSNDRVKVTLVEGWNLDRFAEELQKKLHIDSYEFKRLCRDYNFIHALGVDAPSLEGFLFPDTYILTRTYTEEDIVKILVNQFKHNWHLVQKHSSIRMNMRELTTLASIIQGEAVYSDEMPTISSVYHNRLKKNMLLQADPTIQYILPGKPRRLYNKDLKIDNPYNTYKYRGLPPGPINNPGLAALMAAVNPKETEYLYFVADGEGRHTFTRTNAEHNEAKLELKRKRRQKRKL